MDTDAESLAMHKKHRGKLAVVSKVPLESREDLALAYTPGVAAVSLAIAADPSLAREYTIKRSTVAIVSDGSAVLSLGNIGPLAALPVMEGKAALFKRFADVDAFPICLDVHGVEEIVETVVRIAPVFGAINLEDIAAPQCFAIEEQLRQRLGIPVLHDDQHGTAVVVLAALINILKVKQLTAATVRIAISGAGAAGITVAKLLGRYGFSDITVCDSKGIISVDRTDLTGVKLALASQTNPRQLRGQLAEALQGADVFIGVSKGNILSAAMVAAMNPRPAILAMANPTPEIMPDEAKAAGAFIVATGRSDYPNQINNALAFPGIFRGALDNQVRQITDEMLTRAAQNLAAVVSNPTPEQIIPSIFDAAVVPAVASAITPAGGS